MHSAALQPALIKRLPSMVSQHAAGGGSGGGGGGAVTKLHVAAAELTAAAQASKPTADTLAATQVLAKLCGALSDPLSLHTLQSCCTLNASCLHPLQVLTLQSAVSCLPCRAPSAAARAMCSDMRRRLEEAQGAGAGAGQQGEPIGQYGDALGLWLLEGCVNG
jgi:hypothetical protein|tara:strand:- start:484 stop:972 length:489 start_codon:yes stop_codon:yes gene_type:complete